MLDIIDDAELDGFAALVDARQPLPRVVAAWRPPPVS
jgi:hypothetical protein